MTNQKPINDYDFSKLSQAEKKAVIYMRELKRYQKIEIKLTENLLGKVSVVRSETLREDFPHSEES